MAQLKLGALEFPCLLKIQMTQLEKTYHGSPWKRQKQKIKIKNKNPHLHAAPGFNFTGNECEDSTPLYISVGLCPQRAHLLTRDLDPKN